MSDVTGARGEFSVGFSMMRDVNGKPLFFVRHLGEKANLLDFMVNLLDGDEQETGEFFMIQVKSTKAAKSTGSIPARFKAAEVSAAHSRKVPVYLVAVDDAPGRNREIFFIAIDKNRHAGVSLVPKLHDLNCDVTLESLRDEVRAHHASKLDNFVSKFGVDK